jgi:hypothetical protein
VTLGCALGYAVVLNFILSLTPFYTPFYSPDSAAKTKTPTKLIVLKRYFDISEPNVRVIPTIDINKYPPPEPNPNKKELSTSAKESQCWALDFDCSFAQLGLSTLENFTKPSWWSDDWEVALRTKPHPQEPTHAYELAKETYAALDMADLTIFQGLSPEGRGDATHQCGVLGFKDRAALNTWLDTQCKSFFMGRVKR